MIEEKSSFDKERSILYAYCINKLYEVTMKLIEEQGELELFNTIEMPTSRVLAKMQYNGIYVDKEELVEYGRKIKSEIEEIKQKNIDQDERLNNIKEYDDTYIRESLKNKVEKEEGKGLTTNDFTNTYKEKLDSISELGGYDDTIIQNKIEKLKEENKLLKSQIPERTRKRRIYTYKR